MIKSKKGKSLLVVLTFMMALSILAGCGGVTSSSTAIDSTKTVATSGNKPTETKKKIGYVANFLSHEFYQRCIEGMKLEASAQGVELLVVDSNSDVNLQVSNIENYIAQKVDAIMLSPIDPKAVAQVVQKAKEAGIPVITESNKVDGAATMVGADWYSNGQQMGKWLGEYLESKGIVGKVLIVGFPSFQDTINIEKGFTEALKLASPDTVIAASVDGQAVKEKSLVAATDALTANPDINVIMGINDDSTLGAIQAYKAAGKDMSKLISITHGLEGNAGCKAMAEEKTLTAAYALFPEIYGESMMKAAIAAISNETLPELYKSPMAIVTADTLASFYTKTGEDYKINFESAKSLIK